MRIFTGTIFLFLLFSCHEKIDRKSIYGSWTSTPERKGRYYEIKDSFVFSKPDSFKAYYFKEEKIVKINYGTFEIRDGKFITRYSDKGSRNDIIKLNRRIFIIQPENRPFKIGLYRAR